MNAAISIPDSAAALTPEWFSAVFAPLTAGAQVTSADRAPVGTGQVADTYRVRLAWDRPAPAPDVVIVKVTAEDPTSRSAGKATRTYEIEANFYNELAASLTVRAPRCFHAAHDPEGDGYVVVLEDLAPAVQGDQIAGCTPEEAALAVDELPRLHAPHWGDTDLERMSWLHRSTPTAPADTAAILQMLLPEFLARYTDRLDGDIVELVQRLFPRLSAYLAPREGPSTVTHGDFRLDNLLFGADRVAVLDWQTVTYGPGVTDLSYFLGSAMPPEQRRTHERALVERYREGMAALGVELDADVVWNDYRRYAFGGLIMAVGASILVGRTDRGDDMFMAMAQRHGRQALDLDAEELIGE